MALDEDLNDRLRGLLGNRAGVSEKKMMGGMCFLLNGNMIAGADRTKDGERRFMFRVGKENHALGLDLPGAEPMVQGGKTLSGLFFVGEDACSDDEVLQSWLDVAIANALTLPPK
ncbi:TfoX/Sxy family protein [Roseibium sp. M-1]